MPSLDQRRAEIASPDHLHDVPPEPRRDRRQRTCLCCGTSFESEGNHNRLCQRCRKLSSAME